MHPDDEDSREARPAAGRSGTDAPAGSAPAGSAPAGSTHAGSHYAGSAPAGAAYAVHNATVHSTSEPYADAFIVENGTVSWIGAEESVRHLPGQPAQRRDAEGALAAPVFAGWLRLRPSFEGEHSASEAARGLRQRMDAALGRGVGLLRLSVDLPAAGELTAPSARERAAQAVAEIIRTAAEHPIPVQPIIAFGGAEVTQVGGAEVSRVEPSGVEPSGGEVVHHEEGEAEDPTRSVSVLLSRIEFHLDGALFSGARVGVDSGAGSGANFSASSGLTSGELAVELPAGLLGETSPETAREVLLGWRRFARGEGRQLILAADRPGARPHDHEAAAEPSMPGMDGAAAARFVEALVGTHQELLADGRSAAPGRPTVVVGFDTPDRELWDQMLNTAVHVCFTDAGHLATALSVGIPAFAAAPEGENPWQLISELVHRETDSLSVRAAFNAQVRGARRALPVDAGQPAASLGHFNAGEPATFALWEADALAVQTPESRVAAWSTDARSRTPLLPYLDGTAVPQLTATVIDGVWHHVAASRD